MVAHLPLSWCFYRATEETGATEGFSCRDRLLGPVSQVSQLRVYLEIGMY